MINVITTKKTLKELYYENTSVGFFTFEHNNKSMKYKAINYYDLTLSYLFEKWTKG